MRQLAAAQPAYPPILFFYQGTVADGEAFFDGSWPEARAVSDADRYFYQALGLERGTMRQMLAPDVWACGLRATLKGHTSGVPVGDPWQMPGLFLVQDGQILWRHQYRHAGDHPDFAKIAAISRPSTV